MRTGLPPPGPPDLSTGWDAPWSRVIPYVFAITSGFQLLGVVLQPELLGFDARLYSAAARAWLQGADPWLVSSHGVYFAGPPPSLLPYVPFVDLPDAAISAIWIVGTLVLAVLALRALRAPAWWLIWWPILDGCIVGNSNIAVLALLVVLGGRLSALAPIAKIYSLAPLVGDRRWRAILASCVLLAISLPILPWGLYLADLGTSVENLRITSATTSVYGQPVLMVVGVIALLLLGWRRGAWLAVPVLWPYTQPHYLAPSVPALSPLLAIAWSFPNPLIVVGSLVIEAGIVTMRRRSVPQEARLPA